MLVCNHTSLVCSLPPTHCEGMSERKALSYTIKVARLVMANLMGHSHNTTTLVNPAHSILILVCNHTNLGQCCTL